MRDLSIKNIFLILKTVGKTIFFLLVGTCILLLIPQQLRLFDQFYHAQYGRFSENLYWDFLVAHPWRIIFEILICFGSFWIAIHHGISLAKNIGTSNWIELRSSKIEKYSISLIHLGSRLIKGLFVSILQLRVFPNNYVAWGILLFIANWLQPESIEERHSIFFGHSPVRNFALILIVNLSPPVLVLLDAYATVKRFGTANSLLKSLVASIGIYILFMIVLDELPWWDLVFGWVIFAAFIPIGFIFGLYIKKPIDQSIKR